MLPPDQLGRPKGQKADSKEKANSICRGAERPTTVSAFGRYPPANFPSISSPVARQAGIRQSCSIGQKAGQYLPSAGRDDLAGAKWNRERVD